MTKRKTISKPPAKSRAMKPAPIVKAELEKDVAEDFDDRQKLAEPGRHLLRREVLDQHATSPKLAANDIDAAWDDSDGSETVGGHVLTPDQDRVDDLGEAAGLTYADNEPLNFAKVAARDQKRWELNPASAEDGEAADDDLSDDEDEKEELDELEDDEELEELGLLDDDEEEDEEDADEVAEEDDPEAVAVLEADDEEDSDLAEEDDLDELELLDDDDEDDFDDDEDDD